MRVQSVRAVRSIKGFTYYAYGVYEPRARQKDGQLTYRLVRTGRMFRSDVKEQNAFPDIPIVKGVRHGMLVKP
jgi:hypothetical protein